MKTKILNRLFVLALALMSVSSVWGAIEITFTAGTDKGSTSVTKDNVQITCSKMDGTTYYQTYKSSSITIETTNSSKIVSIAFTTTGGNYTANNYTITSGGGDLSNEVWTNSSGSAKVVLKASTNQVRMKNIVVTIAGTTVKHGVNWYVNGEKTKTDSVAEGGSITLPTNPSAPSSCSSKSFYGWTETASYSSETTAPTIITNPTMGTSDINYYAVFADPFTRSSISDIESGNAVLIVYESSNLAISSTSTDAGYLHGYEVTIQNDKIASPSAIEIWKINKSDTKYTLTQGGKYFYCNSSGDLSWSESLDTWSISGNATNGHVLTSTNAASSSYPVLTAYKDNDFAGGASGTSYCKFQLFVSKNFTTSCMACTDPDPMTMDGECLTNADYSLTENCFTSDNTSTPVFICTSDNKTSCTINGSTFNASAAGTYTIKATQVADGTYCAVDESFNVVVTEPTYNVVATSNNTDLGTVSIEGMVITASPKSCVGYANPAYTVSPNGKATVEQDGNTFTVTPTTNCSIQINFAELTKDTYVDHLQGYDDIVKCGSYTAPSLDDKTVVTTGTDCKELHYHFAGWVTSTISKGSEDVPTGMITAGTAMTASGATYIAVWAKQK